MKTFKKHAAQGEIDIEKIAKLPPLSGLKKISPVNGHYIIGHSETGHHHVLDADRVTAVYEGTNAAGMTVLYALLKRGAELRHLRSFDTHESVGFSAGDIVSFVSGEEYDHYAQATRDHTD